MALKRLNININNETADALESMSEADNMTITEVVRRAISVYYYLVKEIDNGAQLCLKDPDGGPLTYVRMI